MKLRGILWLLLVVSAVAPWRAGTAEPSARVASLKAEYLRLRNNDPGGDSPQYQPQWQSLLSRMQASISSARAGDEGLAGLRLYAADTALRLFRSTRQSQLLEQAQAVLKPVSIQPGSPQELAAALTISGDIELAQGDSGATAENLYRRAATLGGLRGAQAEQRLQGLKNGTYPRLQPSSDLEVPRIISPAGFRRRWTVGPVVIDPGHGGYDAGAVGRGGLEEKEVTLDVARRVQRILAQRYSLPALLTRDSDEFVPLARRTAYANSKGASAFVSLHLNASPSHEVNGLEAYYLDNTNDAASRKLAERENGTEDGEQVDDLSFMLSDLIQSGKLEDSMRLTGDINKSLQQRVAPLYRKARFLGVKKAPFFVLVGAHMPCSLVEMFFVDHPLDGAQLAQDGFREELAAGIAHGVARFVLADARVPARSDVRPVSAQAPSASDTRIKTARKKR